MDWEIVNGMFGIAVALYFAGRAKTEEGKRFQYLCAVGIAAATAVIWYANHRPS